MWSRAFRNFRKGSQGRRSSSNQSNGTRGANEEGFRSYFSSEKVKSGLSTLAAFGALTFAVSPVLAYIALQEDGTMHMDDATRFEQIVQRMQKQNTSAAGDAPIYRIVLTGGPCGGKSTAMSTISDRMSSLGFRVYRVPEAATILITAIGMSPGLMNETESITFEGTLLKTKIALEDAFYAIAKASGKPSIIICDRGTMDTSAYLTQETWDIVMDEFGWNVVDLRDKRYDGVIHMVSAAIGAEKFYTTENNAARSETIDEARDLDFRILNAWIGHPKIRIIDNSTDFQMKVRKVIDAICQMVGAPRPVNSARKFIINEMSPELMKSLPLKFETFEVEQTYLATPTEDQDGKGYTYLRRRGQNGIYTYTLSTVRQAPPANETEPVNSPREQIILERAVSGREYVALLRQADPARIQVKKRVRCFLYNNVYYEIQSFTEPDIGLSILNTEYEADREPPMPWFLKVRSEVTGKKEFSSFYISKHFQAGVKSDWAKNETMKSGLGPAKEKNAVAAAAAAAATSTSESH